MRLDSETQSTRQVYSFKKLFLSCTPPENGCLEEDYFPFGIPYFQGLTLLLVSGRGNPSDAARMAWLVVLVPSRCTEPLRRPGPGDQRMTLQGNDQIFPPTSQMGKLGKSSTSQSAEKKGGYGWISRRACSTQFLLLAVPTCHLLNDVAFCWFG